MKAYTDIEQSKKLVEFLPLESADTWWAERYAGRVENYEYIVEEKPVYYLSFTKPSEENYSQDTIKDIPCWSLAALLDVLPKYIGDYSKCLYYDVGGYYCGYMDDGNFMLTIEETNADNPIDACVEMILKLHEKDLL